MGLFSWISDLFNKKSDNDTLVELTASNGLQEPEMTEITDENIPETMSEEYADGKGGQD